MDWTTRDAWLIDDDVFDTVPSPRVRRTRPLVFLAEDDRELRRLLRSALTDAGFDVFTASTGDDMLKLLSAVTRTEIGVPDALVMDVRMPRCDGLDVLRALQLAEWHQPVVMMTGFGAPELYERIVRYGAAVVLDKPFDASDLVETLRTLIVQRGANHASTS